CDDVESQPVPRTPPWAPIPTDVDERRQGRGAGGGPVSPPSYLQVSTIAGLRCGQSPGESENPSKKKMPPASERSGRGGWEGDSRKYKRGSSLLTWVPVRVRGIIATCRNPVKLGKRPALIVAVDTTACLTRTC